ncbi:hypothetical protein RN001_006255 [Aquatica leii]|uniref:DUF4806 domain-containing protein n=1 Tax=Aquatica leii TaxID=1421715 RepID=A0AAN7PKY6_9COLE|nr:hypothetical protein RN001_006255 [Aquatica leii]
MSSLLLYVFALHVPEKIKKLTFPTLHKSLKVNVMSFVIVEFRQVAIVNKNWLTPRKTERYIDSEDEEPQTSSQLSRPPKVRRLNLLSADDGQEKFQQNGTLMAVTRNRNLTQINESSPQIFNCDTPKSTASRTLHSLNISEDLIHRLISIQERLNQLLTESPDTNSALCTYLGTLGGKDITNKTNRILKCILTDEVAQNYNYFGKRSKKKAFCDLQLNDVIIRAVKAGTNCNNNE